MSSRHEHHSCRHRSGRHDACRLRLLLPACCREVCRTGDDGCRSPGVSPCCAAEGECQSYLQRHPLVPSEPEHRVVLVGDRLVVSRECQSEVRMCLYLVVDAEAVVYAESYAERVVVERAVPHESCPHIGYAAVQAVGVVALYQVRQVEHCLLLEGIEADGVCLRVTADDRFSPVSRSLHPESYLRCEPLADGGGGPEVGAIGLEGTLREVEVFLKLGIEREVLHTERELPVVLEGVGVDAPDRLFLPRLLCKAGDRDKEHGRHGRCLRQFAGFLSCCCHISSYNNKIQKKLRQGTSRPAPQKNN